MKEPTISAMTDAEHGLAWGLSFARGYQELGMLSAAERELDRLPSRFHEHPEAMVLRSQIFVARRQWSKLANHSHRALKLFPDLPEFYIHAVTAFDMMDLPSEGRKVWESAPASVRTSGVFHLHLARFEVTHGKLATAQEHLTIAFELDPRLRTLAGLDPEFAPIINQLERN